MSVTIYDIARISGFSPSTVSLAMNNSPKIKSETKQHIHQIAEQLGYTPNHAAKSLITHGTQTIGVIVPNLSNPFYCELVGSIEDAANAIGYTLILGVAKQSQKKEMSYINMLAERRVDGLIMAPTFLENTYPAAIRNRNRTIPIVLCGNDTQLSNISCVRCDNFHGGYLATAHLLQTGRKRIACIHALSHLHGSNRVRGYRQALIDCGQTVDESLIAMCPETPADIRRVSADMIKNHQVDAFFCLCDSIALSTLYTVRAMGLRVPKDIAVVGYDDTEIAPLLSTPLSSVDSKVKQLGSEAVKLLINIIQNPASDSRKIILQPELKVRESSYFHK